MTGRAALWTEGGQSQDGIKHQSESEESRTGAWIHQGRATEVFEGCAGGRLPGGWTALWMTLGWGPPEGHSEECNGVACAPVPQSEKHTQSTTFTTKISSHWCHHSVRAAESGANKKNKIDQVIVLTIKVCFSCIRGGPWKSSFYHLHNFFGNIASIILEKPFPVSAWQCQLQKSTEVRLQSHPSSFGQTGILIVGKTLSPNVCVGIN